MRGWWPHRDPQTGLYPQNLFDTAPVWRVENSASDLWPFMVLTTWFTDRARYAGPMMDTLTNEIALTSRLGALPDDWNIAEQRFDADDLVDFDVVFGSAEYVKDGLIPIFERLGDPAFFARMTAIASQLCNEPTAAAFTTAKGELLPADDVEINGDVMLTMTRLYTATGDERYLDCSQRIAEYYLFEKPVIASESYRLRDHGGEMTAGLVEAYVGLDLAGRATEAHRVALKDLLDRVLEVGRDEDGFFYDAVNLKTGAVTGPGLADTWGYTYAGYYAYDLAVGEDNYTNEVRRVLENLPKRMSYPWEPRGDVATGPLGSADGYADAIESAIYLLNREPVQAGLDYLESEIQLLFAMQQSDGVIEGWHGDGNFARTALLYAFMHSQGLFVENWRRDVEIGAVRVGDELYVHLGADEPWSGGLCFDTPRHATNLGLPYDYPR
ncbi:MAG: hypothetical protein KC731_42980, partial [Myxococcales bacterium]|nr:hypothetical protein [Myxococcales bacterium]